ncbi:hypothetical protein J1614_006629 [Plenodomus biglobosus]|nr:hypothetical protein J1614_006629 [Plenodomus biglobosus]
MSAMKEQDLFARRSRPQHHSTYIHKRRDWRYDADGFKHDVLKDDPDIRSTWNSIDNDDRARSAPQNTLEVQDHTTRTTRTTRKYATDRTTRGAIEIADAAKAEKPYRAPVRSGSRKTKLSLRGGSWKSVVWYRSVQNKTEASGPHYEAFALTVRLQFTGQRVASLRRLIGKAAAIPKTPPLHIATSFTPVNSPRILDSIESVNSPAFFQRVWTDESQDFDMGRVRATVRKANKEVPEIELKYQWYADAVPIDAIFPPGIPLSAKEIQAYYPHHVRWKGVMLRLTENDYRGGDIMGMQIFFRGPPTRKITIAQMNNFQRDTVKGCIPEFKTIGYKGKSDRSLFTDGLALGQCQDQTREGFVVPTFDDLLRGLRHMPAGLDARILTQCLDWYRQNRDAFNPKLQLNVLHTQALYRALLQPLKPFGPQNLDRNALKEWQDKGEFKQTGLHFTSPQLIDRAGNGEHPKRRSQLRVNLDDEDVGLEVKLPLRHVLTFPFLAIHGFVGEMFKLGIRKAEARRAERKTTESRQPLETTWSTRAAKNNGTYITPDTTPEAASEKDALVCPEQTKGLAVKQEPYRIPKRPRPMAEPPLSECLSKRHRLEPRPQLPSPPVLHTFTNPPSTYTYSPRRQPVHSPSSPHTASARYGHSSSYSLPQHRYPPYAWRNGPTNEYTRPSNNDGHSYHQGEVNCSYQSSQFRSRSERYYDQYRR